MKIRKDELQMALAVSIISGIFAGGMDYYMRHIDGANLIYGQTKILDQVLLAGIVSIISFIVVYAYECLDREIKEVQKEKLIKEIEKRICEKLSIN